MKTISFAVFIYLIVIFATAFAAVKPNYTYKAKLIKTIDGDTVDVMLSLGFKSYHEERLRLARIDAPEMKGPTPQKALEAKNFLMSKLTGLDLVVEAKQTDRYGRYIAEIYFPNGKEQINISDLMLSTGLVEKYPKEKPSGKEKKEDLQAESR